RRGERESNQRNRTSGIVVVSRCAPNAASSRFTIYISAPTLVPMGKKSAKIAAWIEACRGEKLDAQYLGSFLTFTLALLQEARDFAVNPLSDDNAPQLSLSPR